MRNFSREGVSKTNGEFIKWQYQVKSSLKKKRKKIEEKKIFSLIFANNQGMYTTDTV